ncbi:MAG TPA: lipoyl synthase [Acidimicrobiia bacterium]|nr:lipoyl synthase [Acidimicrobiia bacterium]
MRVRWLGRLPYLEAWDLQRALWEGRVEGRTDDDYLLLLEHPHVYTVGRNGDGSNLLVPEESLVALGAEVHRVDRGGDVTYHGPGQLVGYPIVGLRDPKQIVPHVRRIEQALIGVLADLGVPAWTEPGYTGVWTEEGKVAAIGVRVSRGVSAHGFALNVDPDLSFFGHMNPCGITDRPVATLRSLCGRRVSLEEVVDLVVPRFAEAFSYDRQEVQLGAFTRGQGRHRQYEVDRLLAAGTFSAERRSAEPVLIGGRLPGEPPRPEWMKVRARMDEGYLQLKKLMRGLELHTVCEEAGCPNIFECWGMGTATLMILGDRCTRACGFCNVTTGKPTELDVFEPFRAADAVSQMGLSHAVVTSVNRDDLDDGGSAIFASTIREIRRLSPECAIEVLIPDFKGDKEALATVMSEHPEVLNHNTETVLRLQRDVRTAASYGRSLALLARAGWMDPAARVKSGLIVGMGESTDEVFGALADLCAVGVDIVTIGQYLRPTARHRSVHRYVHPDEFAGYKAFGEGIGIPHVESGPLVRSSYHAKDSLRGASPPPVPVALGPRR